MPLAAFVVNAPRARNLARMRARLSAAAAGRGWDSLVLTTTTRDPGSGMARRALAAGASLVFAVGGDGTVRECAQVLAGTGVPLAIVATGTANLAAHSLRLPADPRQALATGFAGADRAVDLAVLGDGSVCVAMAGIGIDAAVVAGTPGWLKRRLGWAAYAVASVGPVLGRPARFAVRLDAGAELTRLARSVAVGNCGLLPGGFALLPAARPDDGVLDVAILGPASLPDWARVGYRAVTGSRADDWRLERYQARRVEVRACATLARQVDGEIIAPADWLSAEVRPGALTVRVPRRAALLAG